MLPSPLFAFLEGGVQLKIVGAVRVTRKPIIVFDKEMFRDKPTPISAAASGSNDGSGASLMTNSVQSGVEASVVPGIDSLSVTSTSSVVQEDDYLHKAKRYIPKLDTLVEFWDSETEVGMAYEGKVTLDAAAGSAIIQVPNAELLTPGQSISDGGVAIPSNTIILKILEVVNDGTFPTLTYALMSKGSISGEGTSVDVVFGGSNKVGEFMQSEFIGWGSEVSIPS